MNADKKNSLCAPWWGRSGARGRGEGLDLLVRPQTELRSSGRECWVPGWARASSAMPSRWSSMASRIVRDFLDGLSGGDASWQIRDIGGHVVWAAFHNYSVLLHGFTWLLLPIAQ